MAKIAEILDIQRSYSTQVELAKEYSDINLRTERMAHYKPIKAHRSAFETIAEGIYKQQSKRSFILSGSFGTGKSHLLLMAANYFSTPSDAPEMVRFFENYALSEREEGIAEPKSTILRNVRKEGRYLVAICDYASQDFETNLLRAIEKTLLAEGIHPDTMQSIYKQAAAKIREWQVSENSYFMNEMERVLEQQDSDWTVSSLIADIESYNIDALNKFKELHKIITSSYFSYDRDNYVEVIRQMIEDPKINENYKGLLILFDEFDYQIGERRFEVGQFQSLLALCASSLLNDKTNHFPVIFTATIHKSFASYRSAYNADDFSTVSDRFDEIELKNDGVEDIIAAVVNPKKSSDIWASTLGARQSDIVQLSNTTNKFHLFDWLKTAQIKGKIIENIYPMHPAATYSLLKLAQEAGSNNRSVVTFFANETQNVGSYAKFIGETEIEQNGELSFYTVDGLFDYFELTSANTDISDTAKEHLRDYETSLRELLKMRQTPTELTLSEDIYDRLLKVMVVFDIIGKANNRDLLLFALNMNKPSKEGMLDHALKVACEKKIIYLNDTNGCYEFKRSDSKDISGMIRDFRSKTENIPDNYAAALVELSSDEYAFKTKKIVKGEPLSPIRYNVMYSEDKKLKRVFCSVKDIETSAYFDSLQEEIDAETDFKKKRDGAVVYLLCENNDEITRAGALTRNNKHMRIMVAVPKEAVGINGDIFSLLGAINIRKHSDVELTSQDKRSLADQAKAYDTNIEKALKKLLDSKNYTAYGADGRMLDSGDNDAPATAMLETVFEGKRNAFKHDDLNYNHQFKENNAALRETVDKLLDVSQMMTYRTDFNADRGDIRYIKNVLVNWGVLVEKNVNGTTKYFEMEQNVSKYKTIIPGLTDMIEEAKTWDEQGINLHKFIGKYMYEYGLGYNAMILFMAVLKRYYKDSISFVKDVMAVGTITVNCFDVLKDLIMSEEYFNTIVRYEPVSQEESEYIVNLAKVFGADSNANLDILQMQMKEWFVSLPNICKVGEIYDNGSAVKFIELCQKLDTQPIRQLVLSDLKEVFDIDRNALIYGNLITVIPDKVKELKIIIENGYSIAKDKILSGVARIFACEAEDVNTITAKVNEWLSGLDDTQKSVLTQTHNDVSRAIVKGFSEGGVVIDVFLEHIPANMSYGSLKTWRSDKIEEYLQKLAAGKKHIESEVFSVTCPMVEFGGKLLHKDSSGSNSYKVYFSGELDITFALGSGNECVFITTDDSNPALANSQREKRLEAYVLKITKDTIVKGCGMNAEGKYSSPVVITCVNDDTKYEFKPVIRQMRSDDYNVWNGGSTDDEVKTIVPVDEESAYISLCSLTKLMQEHNIQKETVVNVLKRVLQELEG